MTLCKFSLHIYIWTVKQSHHRENNHTILQSILQTASALALAKKQASDKVHITDCESDFNNGRKWRIPGLKGNYKEA